MSDEPLKNCPECGKDIRRLIHGGTGVIFKGSGFYVTDKGKRAAETKTAKPEAASVPAPKGDPGSAQNPAASSAKSESSAAGESVPKKSAEGKANPAAKTA